MRCASTTSNNNNIIIYYRERVYIKSKDFIYMICDAKRSGAETSSSLLYLFLCFFLSLFFLILLKTPILLSPYPINCLIRSHYSLMKSHHCLTECIFQKGNTCSFHSQLLPVIFFFAEFPVALKCSRKLLLKISFIF